MVRSAIAHVHFSWGWVEQIGFCVGSALMREKEKVAVWKKTTDKNLVLLQGGAGSVSAGFPKGKGKSIKLCLFYSHLEEGNRFHCCFNHVQCVTLQSGLTIKVEHWGNTAENWVYHTTSSCCDH